MAEEVRGRGPSWALETLITLSGGGEREREKKRTQSQVLAEST